MSTRNIYGLVVITLLSYTACFAGSFGFGGGYLAGFTLSDLEVEKYHYGDYAVIFDASNEVPMKSSMKNFGVWGVYNFEPYLGVEGGLTGLYGYLNEEAQVRGAFGHDEFNDDDFEWQAYSAELGGRYTILPSGLFRPFVDGGLSLTFSKVKYIEERGGMEDSGAAFGYYVGGGGNIFVTEHIAITVPVKARFFFTTEHTRTQEGGSAVEAVYYKPAPLLTVGAGIEYYP